MNRSMAQGLAFDAALWVSLIGAYMGVAAFESVALFLIWLMAIIGWVLILSTLSADAATVAKKAAKKRPRRPRWWLPYQYGSTFAEGAAIAAVGHPVLGVIYVLTGWLVIIRMRDILNTKREEV